MKKAPQSDEMDEIRSLARPLAKPDDLDPLVEQLTHTHHVCIGEASHGTHEYYAWRCELSRRLIERCGFTFIGVEGDWPDCWRVNQWVQGRVHQEADAREVLADIRRWPTWMWANEEVADFLDWLRSFNATRPEGQRVGFYGLDVYSLWDSLREVFGWLEVHAPRSVPTALRAWQCFEPYHEDPQEYAWNTRLVPESCEQQIVDLLVAVRQDAADQQPDDAVFNAVQNAEVAASAEQYYRAMVHSDRRSWNIRDTHMADTVDRLRTQAGAGSKALVWAHNTHVGDARATDMAASGLVNLGQILRERHDREGVALVGFAGYRGAVVAAAGWGLPERELAVPPARAGSHEELLDRTLGHPALFVFPEDRDGPWLRAWRDHRAIGVVYQPNREAGNYVPTSMGGRYDALLWLEATTALSPLHHELTARAAEFETEPSGL